MVETKHLTTKLLQARQLLGLSTRAVAERMSGPGRVSHATLANYEAGRSFPDMGVLTSLASVYDRPLTWFLSPSLTLKNVRYRNRKSRVTQGDLGRYEAHAVKWLEAYRALESALDKPLRRCGDDYRFLPGETGAQAATRVRKLLGLSEGQRITSVAEILEEIGIRAIELPTELALDGLAAWVGGEYVVVLNSVVSSDRARLNAAHEIGHILAGDCDLDDIDNEGPAERRAFEFASHLLLTDTMLKAAFKTKSMVALVQFKERFGISVAAMIYRGQEAGYLSPTVARQIWIEISRRGWKENEPGHVAEDRAIRFERMLDEALFGQRLTLDQAAALAGVRSDELRERHEWALGLLAWRSSPYLANSKKDQPHLRLVY